MDSISIGGNVLIASKVFITEHNYGNYSGTYQDSPLILPADHSLVSKPVVIENNVWISEFVAVLPSVGIGVGSMSVDSESIPPYSIAVGALAKVNKNDFVQNEWIKV